MKKLSLVLTIAAVASFGLGASHAYAESVSLYCISNCGTAAAGMTITGTLDKASYAPGAPIYMSATAQSDDGATSYSPIARGTVSGQTQSSNVFPTTYTQTQMLNGVSAGPLQIGTAPTTAGSYTISTYYAAGNYSNVTGSISYTVSAPTNNASCGTLSAPASVTTGQSFSASVTMNNTGGTTWVNSGSNPDNLGAQSPQDNTTWGTSRVTMPVASLAPGGSVTFTNTFTAPSTAGTYTFAWEMVQEYLQWFGATCSQSITVTNPAPSVPSVTTTNPATSITQTSATDGGTIVSNGGSAITVSGIVWSTSSNPTTSSNLGKTTDGYATGGPWTDNMTGLSAGTTYYVRAYATNAVGTAYGANVSFTTSSATSCAAQTINGCSLPTATSGTVSGTCVSGFTGTCSYNCSSGSWSPVTTCTVSGSVPSVTTSAVTNIANTTATSGGTVVSNGGSAITVSGIVWSTSSNPTTSSNLGKTTDGYATGGPWTDNMTGLTAATTYYVRAYATNAAGTAYGSNVSFTTTNTVTGTGSISAANCTIAAGFSSCSTTVTWSTANVSSVTVQQNGVTFSTALSGSASRTLGNSYSTFPLTDAGTGTQLASASATGICASGTGWNGTTCQTGYLPDLTAGAITPTSSAPSNITLQASIINQGLVTTGSSFNNFIQVATPSQSTTSPTNLVSKSMSALAAGASATTSQSYNFSSVGTYYARACADKRNPSDAGTITESDETNNCGAWVAVIIAVPAPTVTLTASPTSINPGQSSTLTWNSTGATSCQFADQGTAVGTSGTRTVKPTVDSTYSITCTGAGGTSAPAIAQVKVNLPIMSLTANPPRVKNGGSTTITASASNVKSCTTTRSPTATGWPKSGNGNGSYVYGPISWSDTITTQTTYTMTCTQINGTTYPTSATVIVNLAPNFLEF